MKQKVTGQRCSFNNLFTGSFGADPSADLPRPATGRQVLDLPGRELRAIFTWSIDDMPADWERVAPAGKVFLGRPYLQLLEASPPLGIDFGYLLFYRQHLPVGIAVLQFTEFEGASALLHLETGEDRADNWQDKLKQKVAVALRFRVMICGNMLLTGEHGFYFDPAIEAQEIPGLLVSGLDQLNAFLREAGNPIQATMIKDVAAGRSDVFSKVSESSFHQLIFQPSMMFDIPADWNTFEDYLDSLTSKYRVRQRRARRKADGIVRRALSQEEMQHYQPRLLALYRQVANTSGFNMVVLNDHYFRQFKERLPEEFRLVGYFQGDEMVGFATTIANGEELEAHFLGFDNEINRSCQLYLNMLYDIISDGINQQKKRIVFARTALEIKSSVGANPQDYHLYFRHHSPWIHRLVPQLVRFLEPRCEWTARNPFREIG